MSLIASFAACVNNIVSVNVILSDGFLFISLTTVSTLVTTSDGFCSISLYSTSDTTTESVAGILVALTIVSTIEAVSVKFSVVYTKVSMFKSFRLLFLIYIVYFN